MSNLQHFVDDMQALVDRNPAIDHLLDEGAKLLRSAIITPNAVPQEFRVTSNKRPNHGTYNIYRGRGLYVSVSVWGPGDHTDPHTHGTWGLIGVVENGIQETRYRITGKDDKGQPIVARTHARLLKKGDVSILKFGEDEIHELDNFSDRNTVELHFYGSNLIGLDRFTFDRESGRALPFKSGKYDNC